MSQTDSKKYEIFKYGSTWIRADFHLHTNADKEFDYTGEESWFISNYIAKLKEEKIGVCVITNHNKFKKDEFKNLRKNAEKEEIFILPGVELSVNDGKTGIHTLIVFSAQWLENGQDYINQFLNVAFKGKTPEQYENDNGRSSLNLIDTIKELDGYQRDYFLVFAHIEKNTGLWGGLEGGRIEELGKNELFKSRTLGFQKVRTGDLQNKVKNHLNGWYPAEVEGSDCKSIDDIGKGDQTWLKIGDFTFEAVKYALLDYKNRVTSKKPEQYKHSYIKSISFEGGVLDGKEVTFSPELNALIGIRGSGKSSILEAVRYLLDIPFGEQTIDKDYKNALIEHTLGSGGKAVITATDQFGRQYQVKRILNDSPEVFADGKLQPGVTIKETVIKRPIYFGQKDLSNSGEGFEKELVEKLVREKLYDIRREIEEKKQILSDSIIKLKKLANVDEQFETYTLQKKNAEFNLEKFNEYGVADKFKKQTDYQEDSFKLKQIFDDVDEFIQEYNLLLANHEDAIRNHRLYKSKQNIEFFEEFFKDYESIISAVDFAKSQCSALKEALRKLRVKSNDFNKIESDFREKFAETRRNLETELKKQGITALNLDEFPNLRIKIDNAKKMLDALNKQKEREGALKNELLTALSGLNDLWQKEFRLVSKELDRINNNNASLLIEGEFKGDKEHFLTYMKSIFKGSGIRENRYIKLVDDYSDFSGIYKDIANAAQNSGSSSETFEKYFMENLETLLTYQVPNKFTIKYHKKELKNHSLGQRASALILFVLNQRENDLIIIDQPEDDLDNQTIYDNVIKLIKELKNRTQFIFATHNANFPVLGDAEQIHSCRYFDDTIIFKSGSIDSTKIQKEIVNIMEGGKEAFNRRKEIYGIWNSQS